MADLSTITRLALFLFLCRQVCGTVIRVPEEMVPENLMIRDSDSESGFSINQDVLNQLLTKMASIVKGPYTQDVQAGCRGCEHEEDEQQDEEECNEEENMSYRTQNSNYPEHSTKQTYGNNYATISSHEDARLKQHNVPEHSHNRGYVDSREQTFSAPCPPRVQQTVTQRQFQQAPSNPNHQSAGVEYRKISGHYPFTEFSPNALGQSKQTKVSNSNQHGVKDSSVGMQQRYAQQQSTAASHGHQSNTQTYRWSGHQPTQNCQPQEEEEEAESEQAHADYQQQYVKHPSVIPVLRHRQPPQAPSQYPPRLQMGNVSVLRRTSL